MTENADETCGDLTALLHLNEYAASSMNLHKTGY